ncbi:alanine--tRNA ligase-related protein [Sphingobacterium sp. E70]|uniref:alanine--tRNA ligase-related protein n=1 Tax=Sphingobacterium sp. E70 TaxID=2853439 RepID=UPI00359C87E6
MTAKTEIVKYRKVVAKNKEQYQLVLSVSPFYAEGGGQVGDSGELISEETGEKIYITDTKRKMEFSFILPISCHWICKGLLSRRLTAPKDWIRRIIILQPTYCMLH